MIWLYLKKGVPLWGTLGSALLFGTIASLDSLPFPLTLLLPFAWVPYFWGMKEVDSLLWGAFYGFILGLIGYLIGSHWVISALQSFKNLSFPVAFFFASLMLSIFALPFSLFGMAIGRKKNRWLVAPFAWLLLEWGFSELMPWTPACCFLLSPLQSQWAGIIGCYGLTLWLIFFSRWVLSGSRSWLIGYLVFLLSSVLLWKIWEVKLAKAEKENSLSSVMVVQAGVTRAERKSIEGLEETIKRIHQITEKAKPSKETLVLWHEGSVDWNVTKIKCNYPNPILFGEYTKKEKEELVYVENQLVLQQDNEQQHYVKRRLTPIGEGVPFQQYFPFLKKMRKGIPYHAGATPANLKWKNLIIGGLICYEDIFVAPAVESTRAGATVLVSVTNDLWFERPAIILHTQLARMRAIENRRFLIRCNNTGPSEIVSPLGEVKTLLEYKKVGTATGEVFPINEISLFSYFFYLLPWLGFFYPIIILTQRNTKPKQNPVSTEN